MERVLTRALADVLDGHYARRMEEEKARLNPQVGRHTPAGGAHLLLGQPNIFFLTVNAKDRVPWMNQSTVQHSLVAVWREQATGWLAGYYLLMPDHLHLFCAPRDLRFGIDDWVAFWKRQFSRQHLQEPWEFQRRSFHHRLRHAREYADKWQYVRENPLRHGLVQHPDGWPFQGQVHELRW